MTKLRPKPDTIAKLTLATLIVIAVAGWITYIGFGETLVKSMYEQHAISFFQVDESVRKRHTAPEILGLAQDALAAFSAMVILAALSWRFRHVVGRFLSGALRRAGSLGLRHSALLVTVTAGCSYVCFRSLYRQSYEADWYSISNAMDFTIDPPYRHRILFVLVADLVRMIQPQFTVVTCFFISQLIAIILAMHYISKWAMLFVRRDLALTAPLLLTAMLIPTFSYRTFYDIGIVLFYTLALLFLFRRAWAAYLITLAVGTLNHEVMLLLVPVSAVVCHKRNLTGRRLLVFVAVQLVVYAGVRSALFYYLPVSRAWSEGRIWTNLDMVFHFYERPGQLIETAMMLVWFVAAGIGIRYAPAALRGAVILLPSLLLVICLFGKINEARLLNPFLPVAIGLILCGVWSPKPEDGPREAHKGRDML